MLYWSTQNPTSAYTARTTCWKQNFLSFYLATNLSGFVSIYVDAFCLPLWIYFTVTRRPLRNNFSSPILKPEDKGRSLFSHPLRKRQKISVNVSHHRRFRDGSKAVDEDVTGDIDWRTWKRKNAVTLACFFFFYFSHQCWCFPEAVSSN